jgi:hypothetical protein
LSWLESVISEGAHTSRLRSDLPYFAEHSLKLRPKAGPLEPFLLNPAQAKLHQIIEEQKAKTGKVRVIVLKARQLGVSTYAAARLYHRTINNHGLRCIIIGHEKRASSNLFQIVKRYHDHLPDSIRPSVGTSNAEELIFDKLDSGYIVSVASSEGTGRSATAQLLHASEAAYWSDLPLQMASLMQTVPHLSDTEIIIESTANGYNDFHSLWRKAQSGESEFLPVFLPWCLDPSYREPVSDDFTMDAEEKRLAQLYDLDKEQIAWRRLKIGQLGSADYFAQEYPINPQEAFISSSFDSFIPASLVIAARREEVEDPYGQLVIGVDPAGMGADRTSIAWRKGHAVLKVESRRNLSTMEVAGWVAKIIRTEDPAVVNVDVGGLGVGVYDRLREQGHSCVQAINFGGKPVEPAPLDETGKPGGGCANRRSEMWLNLKKALEAGRFSLPDSDSLQADLISVGYKFDSGGRLLLESKADIRKRGVPSPDEGDAVALCFAQADGHPRVANFNRKIEYPKSWGCPV